MRVCPTCSLEYGDDESSCADDGAALVDPLIGQMLGSYRVVKQLGRGGMGGVYLAEHPIIRSRVAVKVMHDKYASNASIVDRFYNEARAVNMIGHDNVLKILDLGTESGRPYFVMELLEGRSLQELVAAQQPALLSVAGPIVMQICAALQAAHDKGIVHRDLKPENIYLITVRGQANFVKVVDFGIARLADEDGQSTGNTRTGTVMGTPAYMSPEQGSGLTKQIDGRSDVYSLGIIMYQLATGHLPFRGQTFGELLASHLQEAPVPPRVLNPEISPVYEAMILRALNKRQEDRFQRAAELAQALGALLRSDGIAYTATSNPPAVRLPRRAPADTVVEEGLRGDDERAAEEAAALSATVPDEEGEPGAAPVARHLSTGPPRAPTHPPLRATTDPAGRRAPGKRPSLDRAPAAPPKSNWRWLALAAVVLLTAAGLAASMSSKEMGAGPLRRRPRAAAVAMVALDIATEPPGARATATWADGSAVGETPLSLQVPANAKIQLAIEKEGFAPQFDELVMTGKPRALQMALSPAVASAAPAPGPAAPRSRPRAARPEKSADKGAEKKTAVPDDKNGLMNPF